MSLEVDGRHGNVPIPCQRESESFKYFNGHPSSSIPPTAEAHDAVGSASERVGPPEMSKPRNLGLGGRVRMPKGLIFCWSALFALVFVLAIVAAGVAGSIAARRGKNMDACMNTLQNLATKLDANASSRADTSIGVNSTDIANSTCQNSNPWTFITISDCGSLASPYTPSSSSSRLKMYGKSFDIYCGTDFYLHNTIIVAFTAFTFEDCIGACAIFNHQAAGLQGNLTCYYANFVHGNRENGSPSCYLRGIQDLPPTSRANVDSARLVTD